MFDGFKDLQNFHLTVIDYEKQCADKKFWIKLKSERFQKISLIMHKGKGKRFEDHVSKI